MQNSRSPSSRFTTIDIHLDLISITPILPLTPCTLQKPPHTGRHPIQILPMILLAYFDVTSILSSGAWVKESEEDVCWVWGIGTIVFPSLETSGIGGRGRRGPND